MPTKLKQNKNQTSVTQAWASQSVGSASGTPGKVAPTKPPAKPKMMS